MGLVLSRRKNEAINIGDNIEVQVIDIRGDKVRLRVEAPKEIGVHRSEVYKRRKAIADLSDMPSMPLADAINRTRSERTASGEAQS